MTSLFSALVRRNYEHARKSRQQKAKLFDCKACGACCAPSYDDDRYVQISEKDYARLSSPYRNLLVVSEHVPALRERIMWLRSKINQDKDQVCACLVGTLGESVRCSIYEDRPGICRSFKAGSIYCKEAREEEELSA